MLICSCRLTETGESRVPCAIISFEALLHKLHTTESLAGACNLLLPHDGQEDERNIK